LISDPLNGLIGRKRYVGEKKKNFIEMGRRESENPRNRKHRKKKIRRSKKICRKKRRERRKL